MKLQRTANAGILLTLDGVTILLDGVCKAANGYLGTPALLRKALEENPPDVFAYTHTHSDHYDPDFAAAYRQAGGVIVGPGAEASVTVGKVKITCVPARHIGKAGLDTPHVGIVVEGSRCLWFFGDSAPIKWRGRADLPKPDVAVGPYAYAIASGWEITRSLGARDIIILHLPDKNNDPYCLWQSVLDTVKNVPNVCIPDIGETIMIDN